MAKTKLTFNELEELMRHAADKLADAQAKNAALARSHEAMREAAGADRGSGRSMDRAPRRTVRVSVTGKSYESCVKNPPQEAQQDELG